MPPERAQSATRAERCAVYREAMREIVDFLSKLPDLVEEGQVEGLVRRLLEARRQGKRVFLGGAGRSGLVGRAFALRLMHMGFEVYVFGDTIVPAVRSGDLVIVISGSGATTSSVVIAETAKGLGATVVAVTSRPKSPLARVADHVLVVPGRTKLARENNYIVRQIVGEHEPLTPLGTLFEVAALVTLDSVVTELMKRLGISEEEIRLRHANIE